ncbi:hypothetical protein [Halobacillus massiliensis]|uniref:hypothetical protein n=1 Tax=Halobacillus massiliensis TaxID=1926286 RepID=UPI0009E50CE9|nr:hypothetical protein [Halobacillus massiliensis]
MPARVAKTIRLHPDTLDMAQKLAKKNYGKENKIGYVMDDAIKELFTNGTRPGEASAILSTTEEVLIDRLDRRVNSIFDNVINRMGDLYARTSHDAAVTFVMMEDLFLKTGGTKQEVGKLRGDAQRIMEKRLESAGAMEKAKEEFEEQFSSEEVERLKEENQQIKQKANDTFKEMKADYRKLEEDKRQCEQEKDHLIQWYEGLEQYLKDNYSRLKPNTSLIEEYRQNNPVS